MKSYRHDLCYWSLSNIIERYMLENHIFSILCIIIRFFNIIQQYLKAFHCYMFRPIIRENIRRYCIKQLHNNTWYVVCVDLLVIICVICDVLHLEQQMKAACV